MNMNMNGKVALITGGSAGIGLGCAEKFAELGAQVVIAAIDKQQVEDAVTKISTAGGAIHGITADVSDSHAVQNMVEQVVNLHGGIDYVVNSAGIQRYGTAENTDETVWDEVLNVNVKSMYLTAKYVIPEMRKRGGGSIVNISSVQAFVSQQNVVAYSASKGAINALTRAIAVDHAAENIRCNAVCPASVDTPMLRNSAELFKDESQSVQDVVDQWGKTHPIGRVANIAEIAHFVVYLCSPLSSFMTGGSYPVDGGLLSTNAVEIP